MLALALFLFSCAQKEPETTLKPEVVSWDEPLGATHTMDQVLEKRLREQHSSLESIFSVPEDPLGRNRVLISHERPTVTLFQGVTAFAGNEKHFAAGFQGGEVRVWSHWPGFRFKLDKATIRELWWDGQSPYLILTGQEPREAIVLDLRDGSLATELTSEGPLEKVAVSRLGSHVALLDEGNRLWTGELEGELDQVATLRYDLLDMAFTPGEGVLMAVDTAGWLIMWTLPDYEILDKVQIPGGPFSKARFEGPRLVLQSSENPNSLTVWDVPDSRELPNDTGRGRFVLDNEVLYYVLGEKEYIKKVLMHRKEFRAWADKEDMKIKVRDLDGEDRYYCARSGALVREDTQNNDMEPIEVAREGEFSWGGAEYRLADPILVNEEWVLWARYVPGSGHYVWWSRNHGLQHREFQGRLPKRENIRAEIPPDWEEVK